MKDHIATYRCPITLTKKAKEKIRELGLEERSFFLLEKSFQVYIEKYPMEADRILSVAVFFDNKTNVSLAEACNGVVVVLHCVVERERLIATNVTTRPGHLTLQSNWRLPVEMAFELDAQRNEPVLLELLEQIHNMPVAQESSMYVKKRIASWEGYLKIQERTADIPDMTSRYSKLVFNDDFSRVKIIGCQLDEKEWKLLKDLSVKLKGIDQDIGKVLKGTRAEGSVEVELNPYMEKLARQQRLDLHQKEVVFSNFATLSQVKRLRQGFKQLENGLAANPELERLLFENKPPVKSPKKQPPLKFHNRLNEFQREAVIGAMSAEDLYVIQGPPGTGKTTVISEICLQNAKAGLRTLVASQSNLAVDNALGRLLANKDIRILRVGRTESIEEEGKKFIEENVGQYWKDHTLSEVSTQYEAREKRAREIEVEWDSNEQEKERLQKLLAKVEAEVEAKSAAQQRINEIQSFLDQHKKDKLRAEEELELAQQQLKAIKESLQHLNDTIEKDEKFLVDEPDSEWVNKELTVNQQEIMRLQHSIELQGLEDEIIDIQLRIQQASAECDRTAEAMKKLTDLSARINDAKKVDSLKWIILEQNLNRSIEVQRLIQELDAIREDLNQLTKIKEYSDKLARAITYVEQLLERQNMSVNQLQQHMGNLTARSTSAEEIDGFLDRLREELKGSRKLTPQHLISYLEGLYGRRQFLWKKVERLKPYKECVGRAQEAIGLLKKELVSQLLPTIEETKMLNEKRQYVVVELNQKLSSVQDKLSLKKGSSEIIPHAKEILKQLQAKVLQLKNEVEEYKQARLRVEMNVQNREEMAQQLGEAEQKISRIEEGLSHVTNMIQSKEEELLPLKEILSTEPELEYEQLLKNMASVSFTRESLKQEKQKLPLFQSIQGMWRSLLQEANDHDLNEIRKLYVKHSNVIGTTCVASARKDFMESYPVFDVVIIDEVSKATPPELLLPMLKGKKIILVGDHHQLPPLLGNDTLEETLQEMADESNDFEGKVELKKLLNESLFERLFKQLPKTNKTMLAIQYRMHENIMATITQFYDQEDEQLQCGLTDSDSMRDHFLHSSHIQRNNHLLWLDMPNESSFFEERMKNGKSLFNPSELNKIGEMLKELDDAVAEAKLAGRMTADEKKSIGVISFYGEQVKRIDRLIQQELRLNHLTIRTGTVDRFQGMEMDVILLSMVRNHNNKQDDIGFAKDYRRLNVALSRARELLVLIGSTEMFTQRTKSKETRRMYTNVLEAVKSQQGLRTLEEASLHG
ncbi:AAA family ATPase [Bacillus mesophilus]|uniref:AAA family ATPase n=1 Tax=Bacillus mesophilus TaxID=1808955 RepID=A0A6M0QB72_9BACI|nr:AAA family ATPase [Bacillus mesophilus]